MPLHSALLNERDSDLSPTNALPVPADMDFRVVVSTLGLGHDRNVRNSSMPRRQSNMKRLVLGFGLSLLLFSILTNAQDNKPSGNESSAVRTTVRDYIEAYYTGDAHRMEQTLHPHYLKHMIHGNIPMREKTALQMEREVRSQGPADIPLAERTEQISVLDVSGDIASAKLITPHWVDYLTLSKSDGQWKILS